MSRTTQPRITPESLCQRLTWADLDTEALRTLILLARAEDLGGWGLRRSRRPRRAGDVTTSAVVGRARGRAVLRARRAMVVCGLPLAQLVLQEYGGRTRLEPRVEDGSAVAAGTALAEIEGSSAQLLEAERVLLNFLQRLSGIATHTADHVRALGRSRTRLLDTRKTTPGYRMLEKYAVACGGAWNHRLGLFDRVMIKDNHLAATGATRGARLAAAVRTARAATSRLPVEVEVDALDQIEPVVAAGADIVLLDNFTPAQLRRGVALVGGRACTEASGGITKQSLPRLGRLGLDFISSGALVHQSTWVDIGLDWL